MNFKYLTLFIFYSFILVENNDMRIVKENYLTTVETLFS